MTARHVPLGAMYRWISGALRLLFAHPGPLLGASALMLLAIVLMSAPSLLVMGPLMSHPGQTPESLAAIGLGRVAWMYGVMLVLNLALMPPLVLGWFRLLHALDVGGGGRALDLLAPFRDSASWLRGVGYTLLAMLVGLLLVGLFAAAFWTPLTAFMAQASANQAALAAGLSPSPPDFPGSLVLGYFVFIVVLGLFQLAYFIGFAELALRPTSVTASLGTAVAGVGRNLLRLLAWVISLMLAGLVAMLVIGLLLGLVLMALTMISPMAATVGIVLIYVPILLLVYPLMHAGAYLAWKDVLGDAASSGPPSSESLVA